MLCIVFGFKENRLRILQMAAQKKYKVMDT
jgi:hypothetical protein